MKTSPTMWPRCSIISRSRARTSSVTAWAAAWRCSVAIRHPDKVRKVVSISAVFRQRRLGQRRARRNAATSPRKLSKGSPIEAEYKKLSPTPDKFPNFVKCTSQASAETVRLRRRQTQGHQSADVLHPRRCRRRAARSHRGNVPPEGRRGSMATCGRAQHRDWPYCPTQHTSR